MQLRIANMHWITIQNLPDERFQRLTGVKRATFDKMLTIIDSVKSVGGRGRPSKLCNADKLLMMLMYYREYRTFFHISITYGISEPQTGRIIRQMEDLLIKNKLFHLPGKKELLKDENEFEVVLVDVTETAIERPKKNSVSIIQGKRSGTR